MATPCDSLISNYANKLKVYNQKKKTYQKEKLRRENLRTSYNLYCLGRNYHGNPVLFRGRDDAMNCFATRIVIWWNSGKYKAAKTALDKAEKALKAAEKKMKACMNNHKNFYIKK
ncbi:hypothetical protein [Aureispira anguillae]|uniref:Uncharacterized protein n=1 Tax=Aureispira anguillae TaxID=2864201 RepID=A0A915YCM2_9BACT|nr:hypothetical protein [Aureispira anguillae]BDS10625.1 hypothetical protein AsAng_0013340 [Aureispira anguillae]